ncbi:carbamoyl-phosphate synthase large subunit [Chitinivibrio alkaliphilus]|uniref:Carbamoyl phosphate synthase large chain n=1 Tax=Chitinivibrio alkaliphilus ACht1 TaxID=1313304 RepID=U7D4F1_9BACT|nr:carbamoyl-phosphate synthase large subunit [Chitinivibrio alkaliphilus]ERP31369.1 carbamoyl-phosphate synthase, large subunit [Chitinivibrio alkaliphilus ACht1]
MPKRTDIHKIMIIGSGPIVIGQACEFDYSGAQACKALKQEGYEVILVNSNPATIMTDPDMADKTYIEPVTPACVEKIIKKERPDALLPTLGGQTGLNTAMACAERGVLDRYDVELIGADIDVIRRAEDRSEFKAAMERIGLDMPKSAFAYNLDEAWEIAEKFGFPCIVRPSFTMGGTGGGIVNNKEEFETVVASGLRNSPISEVLIDESILGWKEYELEVMRDAHDNVVIVCSIENIDPMGIHTGDSITVAPAQTLTDRQYQHMRDAALAIIREIGVETGGSNVQFAVNPENGRLIVIEMNPRVSRSSALASKATGFPIAKFAAMLSVGYTLDEIQNDITRETPACFEPSIDYVVTKAPRFAFEKFPEADASLGVQMKAVGETMAIGRTFKESLQKALRGLETGHVGFEAASMHALSPEDIRLALKRLDADRIFYIRAALDAKISVEEIYEITMVDPWFLRNMADIVTFEEKIQPSVLDASVETQKEMIMEAKQMGFSDTQLARMFQFSDEAAFRAYRKDLGISAVYKLVDTCAAEFEAYTPYYYSTYEEENEGSRSNRKKIVILGGGPNRIGQGIEFDYCCCQASYAMEELGYESIMVNSNPETVSTDYDTSDKLYFEPLTFEDVMNIIDAEEPDGVVVQFGGQTPLNLAARLKEAGTPIIGTSVESIDRAEDRDGFGNLCKKLGVRQPPNGMAETPEEAAEIAGRIGFPVLLRPSFVLGGRGMRIVYSFEELEQFIHEAKRAGEDRPVLIDKFVGDSIEIDVDAVSDGTDCIVCGVMEHIEEAGVHSGDSACVLPPHTLSRKIVAEISQITKNIARELSVVGLLNIQFAVDGNDVYILEVNPRASRTVPFVSKATGVPWAKIAAKVMTGIPLANLPEAVNPPMDYFAVKEAVLPFNKFPGAEIILGPEMKSTGEVMGIDRDFGSAYAKAQEAAYNELPASGKVFISVRDSMRRNITFMVKKLYELGFSIYATEGTAKALLSSAVPTMEVAKIGEGKPDVVDLIKANTFDLVINIPEGQKALKDSKPIRSAAVTHGVTYVTTIEGAQAAVAGMDSLDKKDYTVKPIQEYGRAYKRIMEGLGKPSLQDSLFD